MSDRVKSCRASHHKGDRLLPIESFSLNRSRADGRQSWCRACHKAKFASKDERVEYYRAWREDNRQGLKSTRASLVERKQRWLNGHLRERSLATGCEECGLRDPRVIVFQDRDGLRRLMEQRAGWSVLQAAAKGSPVVCLNCLEKLGD